MEPITIGGDWIASSIAPGVSPEFGPFFGTVLTKKCRALASKIGSITVGGQIIGTVGGFNSYGIVAEEVDAVKIGGTPLVLDSGAHNDVHTIGLDGDFTVREV